jgi:ABC-2 type transport system permease protein
MLRILYRLLMGAYRRRQPRHQPEEAADSESAASRGTLALMWHQARYDLIASWRDPRSRFFTLIFPIVLLVIFAGVFGSGSTTVDGTKIDTARFFVPGIVTMSIITAAYAGLMIRTANARDNGLLKRRRATPVPAPVLLGGQVTATLFTTMAMSALLLLIARLGYGVSLSAGALAATGVAVVIGTLAFSCLGYAVAGAVGNADAAQPVAQATMMPLYFISGVWIPTDQLPHALQKIAALFPIEHLAAAAHLASVRSSFSAALSPKDLGVLAAWAAAAALFASRRFSWLPAAAGA